MGEGFYDRIGADYSATRCADPRIEERIHRALGDAMTVVNVGAGTGSYEPTDRDVVAVEPSEAMIAQRPVGPARVVRASAERLPFPDASFDAAMAVLSDHHWRDRARGLREMRRVARKRAVVFTWDQERVEDSWLVRDFLPGFRALPGGMTLTDIGEHLGVTEIETIPIPADCRDGFFHAYWARPQAYLDPAVRANISVHRRNHNILDQPELDLGYRLLIADYR